ncbi:insulinase family protein [Rhodobacteraceae bacterium NNCM2]|nr:insulinase family protein [Coraliihabitans acroporae]
MTVELSTLPNGFRVVTEHMPGLASASLGIWVEAGARNETAQQNGIAHFLEHMAFKGTSRRSALQIAEEIEDVGGYLNAYTSRERTAYYARVLSADVPLALDVLADILRDPAFADCEIETERGVILQEIGQSLDTPDDIIWDWLQETAFPDQPMGRAILGPPERVKAFDKPDFRGFIDTHYRPERMILSAAGDVDHARLTRMAEQLFGDMTPHSRPMREAARYAGGEFRNVKELEQAHMALGFRGPGYRDPDYYAAQILAVALGGGMSSRLFQEAREKRGLCYTIFANCASYEDSGLMSVYAGTGAAEVAGLADLTVDELARASVDLSETEVARARAQTKAGLVMGLEGPSNRAERMAAMLSIWGEVPPLVETIAKIDAVDVEATRAAAARLIRQEPVLALYGPVGSAPSVSDLAARLAA